ncbi:CaiB/BaiF CoA-transferase family protein [Novosphingobium sp.]|uniref:CaiB/BaiF CoA transferase family protein n=1 Tax=Novosphingobium sp. TaxID=1874826 RepID=UPI001D2654E1|nr:CaiB/BaiF CoA-transferase family protein [Novosphingobium sp.]MBX9665458.1 CoA transferase [Novosphingobium sp.]
MTGALEGLLVVALEQAVAAPLCTRQLADGGARVIKLERAGGETARHYDSAVGGASAYFAWLNRGKESVVVDVKASADRAMIERMVGRADVFIQNLAPGAAARLGLDAAALVARHPRLIALDICGYGQSTDARDMRAYDMLVQAEAGICAVTGTPEAMAKVGVSIADLATGMNAHAAILEALIGRGRTGRGAAIEMAMFDAMADWMAVPLLHLEHAGRVTGRHGLEHAAIYPYAAYACRDGALMIAIQSPDEWQRFCAGVLGDAALAHDPRFATNPDRVANREALGQIVGAAFAGLLVAEASGLLDRHRIAWGRVSQVADLAAHAALRRVPAEVHAAAFTLPRPAGRSGALPTVVPSLDADGPALRREFGPAAAD